MTHPPTAADVPGFDVLIVGTGHGGAQAAIALRQFGFAGTIGLLGEDAEYPYERPPLSKEYLAGNKPFDRMLIRPTAFWTDRDITVLCQHRVSAIEATAKTVAVEGRGSVRFGSLIWAAGGHPRRLSCDGHDLAGVHAVRSRADVDRLIAELPLVSRVVVVGGGYIGLEAAATLSARGIAVTVLEAQERVLARVAGVALSRFFEAEHRAHGVEVRLNQQVECLLGDAAGRVSGVRLAGGDEVGCDMVIVGIGIVPSVAPIVAAGAAGGNGVAVDDHGRTSLANVYAIGDCALHDNRFASSSPIRLESVQNANDMATCVARAIMGQSMPYAATPWFWSNQYDLRLQTVGLSMDYDAEIVRGVIADRAFSIIYLRDGLVIALDCVNATRDYVQGRKLVEERARVDPVSLADATVPLKELERLPATVR